MRHWKVWITVTLLGKWVFYPIAIAKYITKGVMLQEENNEKIQKLSFQPTLKLSLVRIKAFKAHHSRFDFIDLARWDKDIVTAISLITADAIHKSLYFSGERVDQTIEVGMQFPFYYPFFGRPIVWLRR